MSWRSPSLFGAALWVALLGAPSRAEACNCERDTPEARLARADLAFVGEVNDVLERVRGLPERSDAQAFARESHRRRAARLRVVEGFKGVSPGAERIVITGYGTSDCGVEFVPGDRYVIVASGGDRLFVSTCTAQSEREHPERLDELRRAAHAPAPSEHAEVEPFCFRPESWPKAVSAADVVFEGHALGACRQKSGAFAWRAVVNKAVKGVKVGEIVDLESSSRWPWNDDWFVAVRREGKLLRDRCAAPETTPERLAERAEIESNAATEVEEEEEEPAGDAESTPSETEGSEKASSPAPPSEADTALANLDADDPKAWSTPCASLSDSVFARPASSVSRMRTPSAGTQLSTRHGGCAGCRAGTTDAGSRSPMLFLALALLARRRFSVWR